MKLKPVVAIVGVGLMGGSLGQALKSKRVTGEVVGVFRRHSQIAVAKARKAIDWGTMDLEKGIQNADIVFLCASPEEIIRLAKKALPFAKQGAIWTDVGSTKRVLVSRIESICSGKVDFIGGHPIAGSEKKGLMQAEQGLYEKATWILTPTKNSKAKKVHRLKQILKSICRRVVTMSATQHDAIIAATSHLPHVVAVALASGLEKHHRPFVATGFKDTTRIAAADPKLWQEILLTNHRKIFEELRRFRKQIMKLELAVKKQNHKVLQSQLRKAKKNRDSII